MLNRIHTSLILFVSFSGFVLPDSFSSNFETSAVNSVIYYVDCNGSDNNNGSSQAQAWRSLEKANLAPLLPGDTLLFKRGCTWQGTLRASWDGTPQQRILIGAYGQGSLPKIRNRPTDLDNGAYNSVDITGSYLTLEYLEATVVNPPVDPGCQNNPVGFFVGFNFRNPQNRPNGGAYNLLRHSKASGLMAGAHLQTNTHHNQILRSTFTNNHVMNILTPRSVNPSDDIGAWGILLKGNNHEVAFNYFSANTAWCTYDTPPQGNAVELYEAQNNVIHHNISVDDRVFSELGGSQAMRSDNNSYIYNLVVSSVSDARFLVARGGGNHFGPTYRTKLYHNTVYFTGAQSQGIICGAGCGRDIMTAKNNIIWAEEKAAFADGQFNESNNIYWNTSGTPIVQFMNFSMSPTSMIANPLFVNRANQNFRLQPDSPAIDAGMNCSWRKDLDDNPVPQGAGNDIGAYEYPGASSLITDPFIANDPYQLFLPLTVSGQTIFPDSC